MPEERFALQDDVAPRGLTIEKSYYTCSCCEGQKECPATVGVTVGDATRNLCNECVVGLVDWAITAYLSLKSVKND